MTTITRPVHVKVGHATYDIDWVDEEEWLRMYAAQADKGGFFWVDGNKVAIRTENERDPRHEDSLRETLLHEVLHACWHHAHMNYHGSVSKDELEEWAVGCLSFPLLAVLRENPDVVEYLVKP